MLLFYLRGLYRTRLRALLLDGVVPVVSAVSVAAMAVAMLGLFLNGHAPDQSTGCGRGCSRCSRWALGRIALSLAQRWARSRRLVGKPVLIMGAGRRRRAGGAAAGESPGVRARPDRLPRRGSALGRRGRRPRPTRAGHGRGPRRDRRARPASGNLIVAFSSVADARVSRLIQRCQELGNRGLGRAAHVRHDQQPRRLRHGGRTAADVLHDRRPAGARSSRSSTRSTASSRSVCWSCSRR